MYDGVRGRVSFLAQPVSAPSGAYAEQISLETMARFANLDPVYFSDLFRKGSGRTFTEYLTDFRMDKAKELLRGSDMNVNEIAVAIGYSDARYFSKVFKKKIGIKPTDYRKIYR